MTGRIRSAMPKLLYPFALTIVHIPTSQDENPPSDTGDSLDFVLDLIFDLVLDVVPDLVLDLVLDLDVLDIDVLEFELVHDLVLDLVPTFVN